MINKENTTGIYGIILLAAGASSRLGASKQLLPFNGQTLLQHGLQVAVDTGLQPIITVLGAKADLLKKQLDNQAATLIFNEEWEEGMASSIRCGLKQLLIVAPDIKAVILMVCDQPFITAKLLLELVEKYKQTGKPIIASSYKKSMGTPALFDKKLFTYLLALKGDTGARKLMKENPDLVDLVDFPMGAIDIDTEDDYKGLLTHI